MFIRLERTGNPEAFSKALAESASALGVKSLMVLACDANGWTPNEVDEVLKRAPVPIFGGIFPRVLHGKEILETGFVLVGLPAEPTLRIVPDLSDPNVSYDDLVDMHPQSESGSKTMFVFVDGFGRRISALIDSLFNVFGLDCNYIGGGAGSLSLKRKPCLFTNDGLLENAAVMALVDIKSGIGVAHGWESIGGPFTVTESDRNVVKSLDWQPAFEVYSSVIEKHTGRRFDESDFYGTAKNFPFGLVRIGTEKIVRDPLMKDENGGLVCVGEVPQNSLVDILTADKSTLIEAARKALSVGNASYHGSADARATFFIGCISRYLFLGDAYAEELNAVFDPGVPLVGALTIGEIANCGKDYLEFYNKTAVVGVVEGR